MMTSERGWYPDPSDEHTMRFWTGTQWLGTRTWDGTAWVDQVAPATDSRAAAPKEPAIASPTPAGKVAAGTRPSISSTGYLLFGGAAVARLRRSCPGCRRRGSTGTPCPLHRRAAGRSF